MVVVMITLASFLVPTTTKLRPSLGAVLSRVPRADVLVRVRCAVSQLWRLGHLAGFVSPRLRLGDSLLGRRLVSVTRRVRLSILGVVVGDGRTRLLLCRHEPFGGRRLFGSRIGPLERAWLL